MTRRKTLLYPLHCVLHSAIGLLLCVTAGIQTASANQLPPVTGASFDGVTISWNDLNGASGYNIYRDFRYIDTVTNGTEFSPESVGEYRIAAYDENGNFSPLEIIESDVVPTSNIALVEFFDDYQEPPRNVYGTVYSRTAGEVFWDRENARSLEYIVALDGEELGSTSGNSYWVESLLPYAENLITVTARTRTGLTSEPFTMLFDTRVQSYPFPAVEAYLGPFEGEVVSPQNATLEIYSSTAAELFWDRAPEAAEISFTEVYRDDEYIGSSPGTSFFDDGREPDTSYTYELIAVNVNGMPSVPTFVNPGPFDAVDGADGVDSSDEAVVLSLLAGISGITNANPHVEHFPFIQSIRSGDLPDDIVEISSVDTFDEFLEDNVTRSIYECDDGLLTVEATSGFGASTEFVFDDCRSNRVSYSGSVFIFTRGDLSESIDYLDLIIFDDDTDITIDGNVTLERAEDRGARTITYDGFSYYLIGNLVDETASDTSVVLNQTIVFDAQAASYSSTFTTSFEVLAPWTQGRTLYVTTNQIFETTASTSSNYIVGTLTAGSDDGPRLSLIADTGDYDTWYAELTDSDGARGVVGQWSNAIQFPCIVLNDECK